ncbi:MAG: sulfite exporter TauE/SafE family protein [Chloroflexota bacterium]
MEFYIILVIVALLIGLSKGGLGAVLGILVTPLLVLVMPPLAAQALSLPLLMIGDLFALRSYWKQWDMHYIRLLLPLAILGIILGTYLLKILDGHILRHLIGAFTLLFVAYKVADHWLKALDYHPRDWHGYLSGGFSGLGSALANAGSVPFTAYMLLQDVTPQVFVGTTTLYFAVLNLLKVPTYITAGIFDLNTLLQVIWVVPFIPIGVYLGRWTIKRIHKQAFERFMLVVLVFTSAILLFV